MKNRLNDIRHELKIDKMKDFAELLGVTPYQLSRWKNHELEPSRDTCLNKLLPGLKKLKPDIKFEDLWEL